MFKGNSISQTHIDALQKRLKQGTLLEFGSGYGTNELAKYYTVFSLEHNKMWKTPYSVVVPIRDGFYDLSKVELPEYDAILLDGPPRDAGDRTKFLDHDFDLSVLLLIDDVHREDGRYIMDKVVEKTGRKADIIEYTAPTGSNKGKFACI